METFNELLESQLNEIFGQLASHMATKVGRKFSNIGSKILATAGVDSAQGHLEMVDMTHKLADGFKSYCGSQGIRKPTVDDFADYLIDRCKMGMKPDQVKGYIYGPDGEAVAPHQAEIDKSITSLTQSIHNRQSIDPAAVQQLTALAQGEGPDQASARYAIHQFLRAYPNSRKLIPALEPYSGKEMSGQHLALLVKNVAILLLRSDSNPKVKSGSTPSSPTSSTGSAEGPLSSSLSAKSDEPLPDVADIKAKGFDSDYFSTFEQSRIDLKRECQRMANFMDDKDALMKEIDTSVGKWSEAAMINGTRLLMVATANLTGLVSTAKFSFKTLMDHASKEGDPTFSQRFSDAVSTIMGKAMGDGDGTYDAGSINKLLSRFFDDKQGTTTMFLLSCACFNSVMKKKWSDGKK